MKTALIYAGTTEGRRLAERLMREGIPVEACVATEYGEQVFKGDEGILIHKGRLSVEEMRELYAGGDYFVVVDCTHPFATEVSKNIWESLTDRALPFFRVSRKWESAADGFVRKFLDARECAEALSKEKGFQKIFLTTGSKELSLFCADPALKEKLVVRVLPGRESMEICWKLGLSGGQIIAMQGASTKEMNLAVIRQYGADCLVTKESGKTGGEGEKIEAAREAGIPCFMIQRPIYGSEFEECSEEEAFQKVMALARGIRQQDAADKKESDKDMSNKGTGEKGFQIVLAGMGMGNEDSMTVELKKVLEGTDYLFGAPRLLEGIACKGEKYPYYLARDILPKLRELQVAGALAKGKNNVTVLFSGDSGFYSGCKKLRQALMEMPFTSVTVLPGISSIAAFGAKIGEDWQDALIVSAHGVDWQEWAAKQLWGRRQGKKIFMLTSGPEDIRKIGELLLREKREKDTVWVGYQLSYENERVKALSPRECLQVTEPGLYVAMILPEKDGEKTHLSSVRLAPYLKDEEFCRGKVPMTKEEVREISVCKLGLWEDAVVYDVGSGTGSIAVQMAALSGSVRVYAIEQEEEAVALIRQNKEKFGLENLTVIKGMAPEAMAGLPTPTHAFIGGSKGRLCEILEALYQKNKEMRIVLNTVSLEGMMQAQQLLKEYKVADLDIATVQVSKAKKVGEYHLMTAANPVTIFSFTLSGNR